jgi:CRISPR-associated protein Cmr6
MAQCQCPLPLTVCGLIGRNTHPGLALDKYVESWDPDLKESGKLSEIVQKPTIEKIVKLSRQWGDNLGFSDFLTRWQKTLANRGCFQFEATTVGPLTLHLARASALENAGICLHPIYGFVYLPGTGLKGMARAYAERIWLPVQPDPVQAWQKIEDVFGWAANPDRTKQIADKGHPAQPRRNPDEAESPVIEASCGQVIFYDAWPTSCPSLIEDILNNHHASYYQDQEPPGDWDSPIPVYFLAVPAGQTFLFALGKRRFDTSEELVHLAAEWLMGAWSTKGRGRRRPPATGRSR